MLPLSPHAKTAVNGRITFPHRAGGTPNYRDYVFNKQPIAGTESNGYINKEYDMPNTGRSKPDPAFTFNSMRSFYFASWGIKQPTFTRIYYRPPF